MAKATAGDLPPGLGVDTWILCSKESWASLTAPRGPTPGEIPTLAVRSAVVGKWEGIKVY